ncbi:exodeoxyribonuclease V subunit gamma [Chlamydia vaughanii]|uniref:exodeoxyribonuclease V subunit gamma n=1 Tax=Chlamydia vaughanii TaxID=3112552 RepID=UPI0032B1096B
MNATKHSQAIFSNSPTHLIAKLAEDLFSTYQQPFTKRWILVANTEIGHWLRRELTNATSNHTFMGSAIFSSSDSLVKHLFAEVCHEKLLIPDYITLPLFIHEVLNNIHTHSYPYENQDFFSETSYNSTKKLGSIFKKFYTFSQTPSEKSHYHKDVFAKLNEHFISMDEVFASILSSLKSTPQNRSLHIFGYSHLPKHFATFFTELSHFFPVYFYCFSPSKEYFGDLLSDKVIDFLWRQLANQPYRDAWEHYVLADRQALLANLSHKSQASQNFFLDKEIDYHEVFIPPDETTSLGKLQSNVFHLKPNIPSSIPKDQTITISKSLNPSREVHEIFLKISSLIHRGVHPEEIFILSSQLETYEVYLRAIFDPHLPLYFTNTESTQAKELKEKFLLLSSILQTQGNLYRLLQLVTHPQLQNPIEINKTPFLLKKLAHEWERIYKGKGQPIQNICDSILNEYPFVEEYGKVNQIELWERILPLLYDIQKFINLYSETTLQTYEQHFTNIITFLESTFNLSSEELSFITSLRNSLFPTFSSFKCSLTFFSDFCLDFFSHFCSHSPIYDKPGPYVGSLGDLSFMPKGYTFILGANKCAQSIDLLDLVDKTVSQEELAFSSSEDEENFHFLQTLISTHYELHISYQSSAHCPALPSAYINYIQEALDLPINNLPTKAYVPSLFSNPTHVHASQAYYYKLAKSFCSTKEPLPSLFQPLDTVQGLPERLSVSQIIKAIFSPLDFFLKSNYHVSLHPPRTLETREKLFPTKNQIVLFWEKHLSHSSEEVAKNYLSDFSKNIFSSYEELITQWLSRVRQDPHTAPYTAIFSSSLFHDNLLEEDKVFSPIPVSFNDKTVYLDAKFCGVFSRGIYLCSIDPTSSTRKTVKKTKSFPENIFEMQNYLKAQIALAMLQQEKVLGNNAIIKNVTSLDSLEDISPSFSDSQTYLNQVLRVYQMMRSTPIPLISSDCWKFLDNPEKFHETVQATIETDASNPSLSLFWKFHNRDFQDQLKVSEEQRLLILSLFKEIRETV